MILGEITIESDPLDIEHAHRLNPLEDFELAKSLSPEQLIQLIASHYNYEYGPLVANAVMRHPNANDIVIESVISYFDDDELVLNELLSLRPIAPRLLRKMPQELSPGFRDHVQHALILGEFEQLIPSQFREFWRRHQTNEALSYSIKMMLIDHPSTPEPLRSELRADDHQ